MILAIGIILSIGPTIQWLTVSLITSDAPGIYESAYKTGLIAFPSLEAWFEDGLYWQFFAMAAIIVIFSFDSRSAGRIFDRVALSSFLTLSAADIFALAVQGTFSKGDIFQNILSNLVGGIALAAIVVLILIFSEYCYKALGGSTTARRIAAGLFCHSSRHGFNIGLLCG
ncbi:hypothetical protein RFN29_25750 [Mesorhizobium sp. VK22B]|uniref:Uncharacterized protein n=1 Tax=Mesorhizobium captivum TaxID=3072319 RepID=A0ABU4Z6W5_9HYPH|nr:hypothetical protein [Mesorhizobium sp. VK22B]MDX8494967.1 hypothetical protein [Mesorhizobium sp. VK22B]